MLAAALALAVVIGLSLGLLGGGGSILTVPILLFALDMDPKVAIATSLLVVGLTSAFATALAARGGTVRWRVGLVFGGAGMAGAYAGGHLARFIPGGVLLLLFAAMMALTAFAMMRGRDETGAARPREGDGLPLGLVLLEGVVVGLVTGLVGAGGGFLIVPALVLLGHLPMKTAIGTSLLVISLKSFAGFAGYLGHIDVDWGVAVPIAGFAVIGSFVGQALGKRLSPRALRTAFAWFVLAMAVALVARELPGDLRASALYQTLFVDRWHWAAAGGAIGLFVLAFLWSENKLLGVSTGCAELCKPRDPAVKASWRPSFLLGILGGGAAGALLSGASPTLSIGSYDALYGAAALPVLAGAGLLIGFGARAAGGCTSGHGIVGVAQGARSSLIATSAFMAGGFAVTHLLLGVFL